MGPLQAGFDPRHLPSCNRTKEGHMAYAPPDPKKVKALRERREAEQRQALEVETCYRQHKPGQARYEAWRERLVP